MPVWPGHVLQVEALELLQRAADLEQHLNALVTLAKNAAQNDVATQQERDFDALAQRYSQANSEVQSQLRSVIIERFHLLAAGLNERLKRILQECEEAASQQTDAMNTEHLASLKGLARSKLEKIEDAQDLDGAYGRQLAQIEQKHQKTIVALKRNEVRAAQDARSAKQLAETAAIRELDQTKKELQAAQVKRIAAAKAQLRQRMNNIGAARADLSSRADALRLALVEETDRLEALHKRLLVCAPRTSGLVQACRALTKRLLESAPRTSGLAQACRALTKQLLECAPRTSGLAKQLKDYTQKLHSALPVLPLQLRNWADADWQPFITPTTPPRSSSLRVGFRTIPVENRLFEIPLLLNVFERSQVWLRFYGTNTDRNNLFLGSLVLRLFATLPPGSLRLVVFDPLHLGSEPELRVFANHLKDPEFRVIVTPSDLERHCDELIASAPGISARLPYHYKTVFAMNHDAAAMKEKHTVILLRSLPKANDTKALEKLRVIIETGHVSGFHVLGVLPTPATLPVRPILPAIAMPPGRVAPILPAIPTPPDRSAPILPPPQEPLPFTPDPIIEVRNDLIRILSKAHPVREAMMDALYAPAFVAQTLSAIKQAIDNPRHIPRNFSEFIARGTTRFSASTVDAAEAPLAYDREYKRLINIRFDSEHFTHALVVGMSGQGKSSVLHRVITGLASRYSPNEVQFVLIDDKDGVEFDRYKGLPHVRLISLRGSYLNTLATLEYLGHEMDARNLAMRGKADSISRYRQKSGIEMPRLLLVWDEAYEAFTDKNPLQDRVIDAIRRLAEKGRNAGIHLLLATNHGEVYQIRRVTDMMPMRINLLHKHTDVFADWHRGSQSTVPQRKGQAQFVGFDPEELERPELVNLLEPELERTDEWWTTVAKDIADDATRAGYASRARVFDGTALIDPAQHASQIAARLNTSDQRIPLFLGEPVSLIADQPVCLNLTTDLSDNLLFLGGRDVFPVLMARQAEFLETWFRNNRPCEFFICATPSERLSAMLNTLRPTMTPRQPGPFDPYRTLASLEQAIMSGERQTIFLWGLDGIAQLPETAEMISQAPAHGANIVAWSRAETLEQLSSIEACLDSFAHKAAMTADRHMFSRFTDTPVIDPGPNCATLIEARRTTLAFAPYAPDQPLLGTSTPTLPVVKPIRG